MTDKIDKVRKNNIDQTFKVTLTLDELCKRAQALGFDLDIDMNTEIASLWRRADEDSWAIYTGHWTTVLPWLHGYSICALYLGHL